MEFICPCVAGVCDQANVTCASASTACGHVDSIAIKMKKVSWAFSASVSHEQLKIALAYLAFLYSGHLAKMQLGMDRPAPFVKSSSSSRSAIINNGLTTRGAFIQASRLVWNNNIQWNF